MPWIETIPFEKATGRLRAVYQRLKGPGDGFDQEFKGKEVPLPPYWGGYRVTPERIEFWQGRADRLHDRLCFTRDTDGWTTTRLYP